MQRLSAQDASFLDVEDAVSHMHIGALAILEGPCPDYAAVLDRVQANLPRVPRYRQRLHLVPLSLGRPVWVDDPHFNLGYHLRRTALPEPGGDEQLRLLTGRVMSQRLDRDKPLWEMWMIENLSDRRWALLTKVHHSMVDGVAGAELLSAILDEQPEPPPVKPARWSPERQPSGVELAVRALVHRAGSPSEAIRSGLASPRRAAELAVATTEGLLTLGGILRPPLASSLNGAIGPHRRWDWARADLSEVRLIRRAFGGTVNDVVLSVIAGGFRALLSARGESTDRVVRSLVPVSVRAPAEQGRYNNRVSAIFADLPVGIADPVARLAAVRHQMEHLKRSHEAVAGDVLVGLSGFAPAMLLSLALRAATRMPQRNVNTVTTNVPGPQRPLYAAGRRMLECFPYVPVAGHVRVGVAIFSYDGRLAFGITGDYDRAPDIGVLGRGIERSMADLLEAARTRSERTRPAAGSAAERSPGRVSVRSSGL
ncbi:MAG TPA: wax ester/triacylglycerol synthase family O-acyltransferase [Gemmatimonadales bacterium]